MTIVNKLRKLIKNKGGNPIGVMTIADGVNRLDKMEEAANPLSALTIDADIGASVDLLGKYVADLQKDVVVGKYMLEGELNYIDDYTGFSGDPALQIGHYIALHAEVPDVQNQGCVKSHPSASLQLPMRLPRSQTRSETVAFDTERFLNMRRSTEGDF